jgi:hypothetical protein
MTAQVNTMDHASANASARRTRRQLLVGGTGALAAVLTTEAIARPAPAEAANGDNVILGHPNFATAKTVIVNSTDSSGEAALQGEGAGRTTAVLGLSERGTGVVGNTTSGVGVAGFTDVAAPSLLGPVAVQGDAVSGTGGAFVSQAGKGLYGQSGASASGLLPVRHGVHGITDSATGYGVVGENLAGGTAVIGIGGGTTGGGTGVVGSSNSGRGVEGISGGDAGVHGTNSGSGNGVHGDAFNGTGVLAAGKTALRVQGPAVFSRSGILTVRAGHSSATKTRVPLTSASLVLATLQQDHDGVWIRSAVPDIAGHSFTVHLSKAAPARTKVAWFIIN